MSDVATVGDVCAVKCVTPGKWSEWYLAHVQSIDVDSEGTSIERIRLIGEDFDRDSWDYVYAINADDKQAGARKLAASQWGRLKAWGEKVDDLKQAIINAAW